MMKVEKMPKELFFFVTDGQPTTLNNFDDDVANGAINTSKEIKKMQKFIHLECFL